MDPDSQLRRTTSEIIRRETDAIAESAARALAGSWLSSEPHVMPLSPVAPDAGLGGTNLAPSTVEEALETMEFGFRRLSGVVALAVLVDEPALIVEDMLWLARLFEVNKMLPTVPQWHSVILDTYVEAASGSLSSHQRDCLSATVDAAKILLCEASVS